MSDIVIGWGGYKEWEGPFYRGRHAFDVPASPTFLDVATRLIGATEGCYDAVNMYDSCIFTGGLNQWCERLFLCSKMLRNVETKFPHALDPLQDYLESFNAEFLCLDGGNASPASSFGFFLNGQRCTTPAQMQELFLGGVSGAKGSWTDEARQHAIGFAKSFASCWEDPQVRQAQLAHMQFGLMGFVLPEARTALFFPTEANDFRLAARAAYISFAANNPAKAQAALLRVLSETKETPDTYPWLLDVLRGLTMYPGIAIYPVRYASIAPVLEASFPAIGVLPRTWKETPGHTVTTRQLQQMLIDIGYDLGPKGADDRIGPKTLAAIGLFQDTHGIDRLDPDAQNETDRQIRSVWENLTAFQAKPPSPLPGKRKTMGQTLAACIEERPLLLPDQDRNLVGFGPWRFRRYVGFTDRHRGVYAGLEAVASLPIARTLDLDPYTRKMIDDDTGWEGDWAKLDDDTGLLMVTAQQYMAVLGEWLCCEDKDICRSQELLAIGADVMGSLARNPQAPVPEMRLIFWFNDTPFVGIAQQLRDALLRGKP
jgi:hypothetical protein